VNLDRGRDRAAPLTKCENCEAPLAGPYCAECGQHAIDYRRSIVRVVIDAADSFFNWDTKFLRSLGVLLTRPGKLTNDFNAGRRIRYVHPLRLYLLASIAFFLLAKLVNLSPQLTPEMKPEDRAHLDASLAKLAAPESPLTPEQRAKVETVRESVDEAKVPGEPPGTTGGLPVLPNPKSVGAASSPVHVSTNWEGDKTPFGKWMEGRVKEKIGEHGSKAKLFFETLRNNVPTMMLGCIPLFAFVLKILYVRQRRYYVEHLVYALHVHTFAYVGVVVITLLGMGVARWAPAMQTPLVVILSILLAVQVFLSIRRVYRQGWFMTTFKFLLGGVVYFFVLVLALGATAFVTLLLPS
jgi:hypothetical protein